jgi:hypothetical protein
MAEHAKLMSPSSAARRIACSGSYVLESLVPDVSGKAADDGTAMHSVAAMCLTSSDGRDAGAFVGRYIDVHDKGEPVRRIAFTPEMAELVQPYIDAIRSAAAHADEVLIEQRVDFSRYLESPGQFGTADTTLVGGGILSVHDFKSGYHRVEVVRNPQLMLYALGALDRVRMLYDVEHVEMVIHQPKVFDEPQRWTCSVDELLVFGEPRAWRRRCARLPNSPTTGPSATTRTRPSGTRT